MTKAARVCLLCAIASGPASLQTTPATSQQVPPVFRGGTTIVPLDVRVLDKNGKPVTDLKQSDFTVYEDNVRQDIRNFFAEPMTPRPVPPGEEDVPIGVGAGAAVPSAGPLSARTRRTFLIVIGMDSSQLGSCSPPAPPRVRGPGRPVEGALSFLQNRLLPQDAVAVLAFNRVTALTTDHARLIDVVTRYQHEYERIADDIHEWQCAHQSSAPGTQSRWPFSPEIRADINRVFTGETEAQALADLDTFIGRPGTHVRSATDLLLHGDPSLARPTDWQSPEPTPDDVQDFVGRVLHVPTDDAVATTDLLKVYAGIEYLRHLDGEKHVVFLGKGIFFAHKEGDEQLAARANDAGITLDIVHTDGMADAPTRHVDRGPGSLDDLFQVSSAENMTEWTGGFYTGVVKADAALARLDEETRFGYLLGYAPAKPALDGSRRQVKVTVDRPGVTVEFRHNYAAVAPLSTAELEDVILAARLQAGGAGETPAKDIGLQATAAPTLRFGGSRELRVTLTIDASRLTFLSTPSGHTARLDVEIFCGDAKQAVVGDLKQMLDITADDETQARYVREGIPFSARVAVSADVKFVKVVVYDPRDDLTGTIVVTVK